MARKGSLRTAEKSQEYRREYFVSLYEELNLDTAELSDKLSEYDSGEVPSLIVAALDLAALDTLGEKPELDFEILSTVHYRDRADMVTITGAMVKGADRQRLFETTKLASWAFRNKDLYKPYKLTLDQITLREYLSLDRFAASSTAPSTVKAALEFEKIGQLTIEQAYEDFKRVSRFYPSFLEVAT